MSSVFDHDDEDDVEDRPVNRGAPQGAADAFTLQFGTETVVLKKQPGMTVREAFVANAAYLGFDFNRELTFRDNRGNVVRGDSEPSAHTVYVASISHEQKG